MTDYGIKDGEVEVLNRVYGENTHYNLCRGSCRASHIKGGSPKGCLAAHILLCLYELYRIHEEIKNCLLRLNVDNIQIDELDLVLTVLLHDIGKLSELYLSPSKYKHNLTSAYIAFNAVKEILGEAKASIIAITIFLHHEFFEWENVESRPTRLTICDDKKSQEVRINPEKAYSFLNTILDIYLKSKYNILNKNSCNAIRKIISEIKDTLKREYERKISNYKLCTSIKAKYFRYALPLYYVLYLIDNRAASSRSRKYWDKLPPSDMDRPYITSLPLPTKTL